MRRGLSAAAGPARPTPPRRAARGGAGPGAVAAQPRAARGCGSALLPLRAAGSARPAAAWGCAAWSRPSQRDSARLSQQLCSSPPPLPSGHHLRKPFGPRYGARRFVLPSRPRLPRPLLISTKPPDPSRCRPRSAPARPGAAAPPAAAPGRARPPRGRGAASPSTPPAAGHHTPPPAAGAPRDASQRAGHLRLGQRPSRLGTAEPRLQALLFSRFRYMLKFHFPVPGKLLTDHVRDEHIKGKSQQHCAALWL
ncbi:translation initiation factor IF-2-like [Falco naumanni]|uniref:translation initiation factor IF-2-like n=1 Tax=Falco naumanni TaxID=148594 RepID=UPI001ADEB9C3|nr:translation initiation factor IF-2-like [Falco naumanni]